MRTIVVPTDFSDNALYAATYASGLAGRLNARLVLLHVYQMPAPVPEVPLPYPVDDVEKDIQSQLNQLKERLISQGKGLAEIQTVIRSGEVVTEIRKYCEEINPYSIIMGAESAGAMERLLFGGKTLSALRNLSWPLIIVPPFNLFNGIRKAGLACDFREVIGTVRAAEIRDLVKEFGAELHVLYISDEEADDLSADTVEESGWLQEMLSDLKPQYHFLKHPDIESGILDYSRSNNLDLLIVIPKKHSLVERIFNRSHSKNLVLHAPVPILSLHE